MCARSANDTSDNPHNPMYGIYKAGGDGDIVSLVGSRSSDSGGRSVAPASMIDLSVRPTKISSGNDARVSIKNRIFACEPYGIITPPRSLKSSWMIRRPSTRSKSI